MLACLPLNRITTEPTHSTPISAGAHQRSDARSGLAVNSRICDNSTSHKPTRIGCKTKNVYSSMGTQPITMPVTSAGSYHHTPVATK